MSADEGRSRMQDGWTPRLHKWFPFLHTWRSVDERDRPYRQCVTCGQMQMMAKSRRR